MSKATKYLLRTTVLLFACFTAYVAYSTRKPTLKQTLERTMDQARRAVRDVDYDAFIQCADVKGRGGTGSRKEFKEALSKKIVRELLLDLVFPDLEGGAGFLALKRQGDWAGYYSETYRDDPNHATVNVCVFRRSGGRWKARGAIHGVSKARPGSEADKKFGIPAWKGREEMLEVIETDPDLDLEKIIRKLTEKKPAKPPAPGGKPPPEKGKG